jgi:tetratricopeptide (TPR) repeat protein
LLDGLTATGRRSNTLVVVASDHGEGLGEHGELTHGIFVYDSTLRVPLVLAGPGFPSGARIERGPVGLVDVLPTVLAKLGLESPPHIAGHDLFADESSDVLYAETYLPRDFYNWSPLHALRSSRVKFIEAPHPELYDLDADPGETSNIIGLRARTARQLSDALTDLVAAEKATDSSFQPDPGLLSDLQSLGYVGGGVPSSARPPADDRLPDPKEKIGLVADLDEVIGLFGSQRFEEADRKVQKILESDPENFLATHYLGETLFELGRDREAIQAYRQAIERGHETPYHHFRLGLLHERLGEYSSAAQEFGRAVELSPAAAVEVLERARDLLRQEKLEGALGYLEMLKERGSRGPALALMLASAWGQKGETEKALRAIEDGLIGEAENPQLLSANGRLLAELGRLQEAIISLEKALTGLTEPDERLPVLRTLAGLYGERGKLEKSIGYFEQAVALEPSDFETVANLALTMVRAGKTDAALGPLTHAIELRPDEVRLLNLKAEVLYRRGELEASPDLLRRSLAIRPDQPRIRQALAEVEGKLESR